jgi:hypothetical protein
MRGHILEVELNFLDMRNFDNVHDFFMKFKYGKMHGEPNKEGFSKTFDDSSSYKGGKG